LGREAVAGTIAISLLVLIASIGGLVSSAPYAKETAGTIPPSAASAGLIVNPVHTIDLSIVLPSMIAAGIGAMRGRRAGLLLAAPLLAFSVLMGTSLVAPFALQAAVGGIDVLSR
jgi:hypothetical protein